MWARIHLIPALQAEEDRDLVRRHLADQAREKELLGENIKVYNSDRCVFTLLSGRWAGLAETVLLTVVKIRPPNFCRCTRAFDEIEQNRTRRGGDVVIGGCWTWGQGVRP
jgi:hypothetical protein